MVSYGWMGRPQVERGEGRNQGGATRVGWGRAAARCRVRLEHWQIPGACSPGLFLASVNHHLLTNPSAQLSGGRRSRQRGGPQRVRPLMRAAVNLVPSISQPEEAGPQTFSLARNCDLAFFLGEPRSLAWERLRRQIIEYRRRLAGRGLFPAVDNGETRSEAWSRNVDQTGCHESKPDIQPPQHALAASREDGHSNLGCAKRASLPHRTVAHRSRSWKLQDEGVSGPPRGPLPRRRRRDGAWGRSEESFTASMGSAPEESTRSSPSPVSWTSDCIASGGALGQGSQ
jgi:hypothetical protein